MHICFYIEKNSDLHLIKMQIYFVLRKIIVCTCKFIDIQEKDYNNHIKNNHAITKQQLTIYIIDI